MPTESPHLKQHLIQYQFQKLFPYPRSSTISEADKINMAVEILMDPWGVEAVAQLFEIKFANPDTLDRVVELVGKGAALDLASNHTCHGDGIGLARLCNSITNKARQLHYQNPAEYLYFDGFYLPVAQSLINGHQDDGDPLQKKETPL